MAGVNKVIVIGRLGTDPELKQTGSGQSVCTINVATSENWTDRDGNKQERTEWHRIVIWGKQAENCAKYLSKGRQVYVEGKLQTRSWEAQDGQKKYTTEIIANTVQFLSGAASDSDSRNNYSQSSDSVNDFSPEPYFDASEEVPF